MMLLQPASRKDFLDVVQGKGLSGNSVRSERVYRIGNEELLLVWREDSAGPRPLPAAVVVDEERQRDFLAWVWTYMPTVRPLTAYSRVVSEAVADRAIRRASEPTLGSLQGASLGLILGEAVTHLTRQSGVKRLSLMGCESTYSYSLARGIAVEAVDEGYSPIGDAWKRLGKLGHHSRWPIAIDDIQRPWDVVLKLRSAYSDLYSVDNALIVSACRELYREGDIQPSTWDQITKGNLVLRRAKEDSTGPIEDRVRVIEAALDSVATSKPLLGETGSFLAGYLTSRIGPGTIDHINLLIPRLENMTAAILWYGLCAGLQPSSRLEDYSKGLGRRVLRELLRSEHFLDNPRCDIALNELEMLSGASDTALREMLLSSQSHIEVEVAPCVTSVMRWPLRAGVDDSGGPGTTVATARPQEVEAQSLILDVASGSGRIVSEAIGHLEKSLDVLRALKNKLADTVSDTMNRPSRKRGRRR